MHIEDIRECLVRSRSCKYASRSLGSIRQLVVHHSGTRGGAPEDFARYHVYVNGWPGIGYHYVISREGTVYKTNALSAISYHARGANMESVGLCLVGNFNLDIPSGQQLDSLNRLLLILHHHLPRSRVVLHREVPSARTSCPGMRFPVAKLIR